MAKRFTCAFDGIATLDVEPSIDLGTVNIMADDGESVVFFVLSRMDILNLMTELSEIDLALTRLGK